MRLFDDLEAAFRRGDAFVGGWPDTVLTWGLLAVAAFCILAALRAKPMQKAAIFAWMVLP